MCHAHWVHSRHRSRSEFGPDFREGGPDHHSWREYFMRGGGRGRGGPGPGDEDGGGFGVRRPLRFLAYKLELDEKQIEGLARILDALKTERAQAAVDDRRSLADFADAVGGETFDAAKVGSAGDRRADTAVRLKTAVTKALGDIHALLNPDQRGRLAYLIRTGVLSL